MREAAQDILESSEFRFSDAQDPGILEWVLKQLRKLFEALQGLRETSPVLAWLLVAACVLVLLAIFWHAFVVMRRSVRAARVRGGRDARTKREKSSTLLARARELAAAGDVAGALTGYLRAIILGLEQRGVQRAVETATVREYLQLLRRHAPERSLFEQFLRFYEPGVFGRHPFGPEPMREVDRLAGRLAGA